ncbi:hypothetical protein J7L13_01170 [bacterium]|nr:hypothetical protein [bacterium]
MKALLKKGNKLYVIADWVIRGNTMHVFIVESDDYLNYNFRREEDREIPYTGKIALLLYEKGVEFMRELFPEYRALYVRHTSYVTSNLFIRTEVNALKGKRSIAAIFRRNGCIIGARVKKKEGGKEEAFIMAVIGLVRTITDKKDVEKWKKIIYGVAMGEISTEEFIMEVMKYTIGEKEKEAIRKYEVRGENYITESLLLPLITAWEALDERTIEAVMQVSTKRVHKRKGKAEMILLERGIPITLKRMYKGIAAKI